jgi:hypothetical protein
VSDQLTLATPELDMKFLTGFDDSQPISLQNREPLSRKALPARTGLRRLLRSKDVLDAEVLCRPGRVTTEARERSGWVLPVSGARLNQVWRFRSVSRQTAPVSDPEIGSGSATSGLARRGDGVRGTVDVKPPIGRQVEDFASIWQGTALRLQLDVHRAIRLILTARMPFERRKPRSVKRPLVREKRPRALALSPQFAQSRMRPIAGKRRTRRYWTRRTGRLKQRPTVAGEVVRKLAKSEESERATAQRNQQRSRSRVEARCAAHMLAELHWSLQAWRAASCRH